MLWQRNVGHMLLQAQQHVATNIACSSCQQQHAVLLIVRSVKATTFVHVVYENTRMRTDTSCTLAAILLTTSMIGPSCFKQAECLLVESLPSPYHRVHIASGLYNIMLMVCRVTGGLEGRGEQACDTQAAGNQSVQGVCSQGCC